MPRSKSGRVYDQNARRRYFGLKILMLDRIKSKRRRNSSGAF
jgi:hypothetical protein